MLYAVDVLEQKLLPEKPETSRRIHEDQRIVPAEQFPADPEVLRRQLRSKDSCYRVLCPHRAQSLPPTEPEPAAVPGAALDIPLPTEGDRCPFDLPAVPAAVFRKVMLPVTDYGRMICHIF